MVFSGGRGFNFFFFGPRELGYIHTRTLEAIRYTGINQSWTSKQSSRGPPRASRPLSRIENIRPANTPLAPSVIPRSCFCCVFLVALGGQVLWRGFRC